MTLCDMYNRQYSKTLTTGWYNCTDVLAAATGSTGGLVVLELLYTGTSTGWCQCTNTEILAAVSTS
jgi:hypothetical protein